MLRTSKRALLATRELGIHFHVDIESRWRIWQSFRPNSRLSSAWYVPKALLLWNRVNQYVQGGIAFAVRLRSSCLLDTLKLSFADDIWMYVPRRITAKPIKSLRYTGAGAAYGTAKSGIGIAGVGTFRPDLIMKVQSMVHGIYGHKTDNLSFVVIDPSGYGWYNRRLFPCDSGPHRWRS